MSDLKNKKDSELKYHSDPEEFIPYAAHLDPETIITKNGELLQVIKVTGFAFETINESQQGVSPLRKIIRRALKNHIDSEKYAIWIHTLRRKTDISVKGEFQNDFSKGLNEKWMKRNEWDEQFVNELYISILTDGEPLSVKNPKFFFESLFVESEKKKRSEEIDNTTERLNEVTSKILGDLKAYGARKLGIYYKKEKDTYFSEILRFCSKLMNLEEEDIPLIPVDLSCVLPTHNVTFQYNTIQVEGETGTHYGAILSVKEYQEITVEQIDRFLQLPVQFMVTESFDFVPKDMAVKEVKDQKYIYEVSGSKKMYKLSGIQQMVEAEGEPCDFGEHQIIITLLDDKVKDMQKSLKVVVETLRDLGVVFVREDLFMEDCYWSCMPGNFDFIRRQSFIPTSRIAGYASLYNFPAGKREGNLWGDAVTVFRTADDTPYFFNFHFGDNGHTAIIGPYGAGKTVLLNFLVSEAQKYDAKTVYFEKERGSEAFIRAAGGKYKQVTNEIDKGQLSFNPLILKDTLENREFLKQWFEYLIQFNDNNSIENISDIKAREVTKEDVIKIDEAVKYIFKMPHEDRMLSNIIPKIWKEGEETYEIMKNWFGTGKYAKYFDSPIDNSEINSSNFIAFDISKIVKLKTVTIPMISYLLHALEQSLDGFDPAIIVLDEAWEFIDNPAFQPRLKKWLRKMADKNAIVIFASESVEKIENSAVTNKLFEVVQTQIFLPNKLAGESYEEIFKLSKEEYEIVKNLNKDDRKFLLRHGPDSIVAKLNLEGMDRELAVLSANDERLKKMEEAISEKGDKPENWLPKYFELLNI